MISEQDKEAILNGATAVSASGLQAKLLFIAPVTNGKKYLFLYKQPCTNTYLTQWLDSNFTYVSGSHANIVGLWKNETEPFNLEKALTDKPVVTRSGKKAYVKYKLPNWNRNSPLNQLVGFLCNKDNTVYTFSWSMTGKAVSENTEDINDIVGMWKEPEKQIDTFLIPPKALKEPKENMWFVNVPEQKVCESSFTSEDTEVINSSMFSLGMYFDSKEKAEVMLHFLKNNKE